jgi:predicted peptidase
MNRSIFSLVFSLMLAAGILLSDGFVRDAVAASPSQLLKQTYASALTGTDRDYWLYLPAGMDDNPYRKWPVILFLHGGGERGSDIDVVLKHGPIKEVAQNGRELPFIIIAPQMPALPTDGERPRARRNRDRKPVRQQMLRETTGTPPSWGKTGPPHGWHELESELLEMVDNAIENHHGDPDRVYITGLSYGGFGTWRMIMQHPERWAAAAPICGAGDIEQVEKIGTLPVWVFQGGLDTTVLPEWTLATADALDAAGGNVRVTVHEDCKHDCWTRVYEGADLYHWFLSHRKNE